MYRTHNCGELNLNMENGEVVLSGFVHERRDLGGLIFLVLRDRSGLVQVIVDPANEDAHKSAEEIRSEFVIKVVGTVKRREAGQENNDWPTGRIEINATEIEILNQAKPLPFEIAKDDKKNPPSEDLRLKYRYLDFRRGNLLSNISFISKAMLFTHNYFQERGFLDVKTPILANSSPEGARDFLVASRTYPGKFYALPQAPQQFKQMLMLGGVDRYYQIAPCFRDEDPRADRLPGEFYQIDAEMSFVEQEDVLNFVEGFVISLFEELTDKNIITKPFRRMSYAESLEKYGTDKPDLRFEMEIIDVSEIVKDSEFGIFSNTIKDGGKVRCLVVPEGAEKPRKYYEEELLNQAKRGKAKGLAHCHYRDSGLEGSFIKFLSEEVQLELIDVTNLQKGDSLVFVADNEEVVSKSLGHVRYFLGQDLELVNPNEAALCWILDMPFFEWDDDNDRIDFGHNPFSAPQGGLEAMSSAQGDKEKLLNIKAWQYDLAYNGYEILSGGIRNSNPESIAKAFEIVGYTEEEIQEKFGYIREAYTYGAPPHGGFAIGLDRMVMALLDETDIRQVFAFPKSSSYRDLMTGSPHEPTQEQLKELGIKFDETKS